MLWRLAPKKKLGVGAHLLTGLGESECEPGARGGRIQRETQCFSLTCVYPRMSTCIYVGVNVFRMYMHLSAHMLTCTCART